MRFDDRLVTLLEQQPEDSAAASVLWSQLVDIFAQDRGALSDAEKRAGVKRMESLWPRVAPERRRATAMAVSARLTDPDLVLLFATDAPAIATPALQSARLEGAGWQTVIPRLAPHGRSILRGRPDLPVEARNCLAQFGTVDFTLPSGENAAAAIPAAISTSQISDLVSRIESWRKTHPLASPTRTEPDETPTGTFRFETDATGAIVWLDGGNRTALLGLSIGEPVPPGAYGVDGQCSGAFAKRSNIRNARLNLPGAAGAWRVSADPVFRDADGRFIGYRGIGRRPRADEIPAIAPPATGLAPDLTRQIVHELRTPLNAVRGFAEMIEGEVLGSVAEPYRAKARDIVGDADRLITLVEELDCAAREEPVPFHPLQDPQCDPVAILTAISDEMRAIERDRNTSLKIRLGQKLPMLALEQADAHRLFGRLVSAMLSLCASGESLSAEATARGGKFRFAIDRPSRLKGMSGAALASLDAPEGNAPEDFQGLGLAFTLRLLKSQAEAAGGRFDMAGARFALILNPVQDSAEKTKERK